MAAKVTKTKLRFDKDSRIVYEVREAIALPHDKTLGSLMWFFRRLEGKYGAMTVFKKSKVTEPGDYHVVYQRTENNDEFDKRMAKKIKAEQIRKKKELAEYRKQHRASV